MHYYTKYLNIYLAWLGMTIHRLLSRCFAVKGNFEQSIRFQAILGFVQIQDLKCAFWLLAVLIPSFHVNYIDDPWFDIGVINTLKSFLADFPHKHSWKTTIVNCSTAVDIYIYIYLNIYDVIFPAKTLFITTGSF